jgi:subtilisin family serine protease
MSRNVFPTVTTVILALLTVQTVALSQSRSTLPSNQTRNAIQSLQPLQPPARYGYSGTQPEFQEYQVDAGKLPPSSREKMQVDSEGQAKAPLLVPNTMVIQFVPNASRGSINEFLERRHLKVIETFPNLGAIKVQANLSKYFTPELTDNSANDALLRGMTKVIDDFQKESIVRSATPDVVLRTQSENGEPKNVMKATEVRPLALEGNTTIVDWGIKNIEADQLWDLPGAHDGVLVGVMDVGFGRHQYITFLELNTDIQSDDHGNHVAGIACGHYVNAIRGVLPNCFVRARTGKVFFNSPSVGAAADDYRILESFTLFSQILATADRFFTTEYDDTHVYNVSLGYNWKYNFNVNPDLQESAKWRKLVEQQGLILVTALEIAERHGKVIFSAAGNDSSDLATPINAKYASPFNWAALTARERGIARNGVVVEAHDPSNKRATFSNVGGNMSCPGVDILSAVAHDQSHNPSQSLYGLMSGTSQASPYCAAAYALLSLVRPGYTPFEILDCLSDSTEKSDTGVPIPKLTQALRKCPG